MKKRMLAMALALSMVFTMTACGTTADSTPDSDGQGSTTEATGETYKVGIVNYVDDASLNQIVANIESELDAKGAELGVTFEYEPYYSNAQADSTVLNQIAADLVADDVDVIVAIVDV